MKTYQRLDSFRKTKNPKDKNDKKPKKIPPEKKLVNKVMPYVFSVTFAILLLSLVNLGPVNGWLIPLGNALRGLLSSFGAFTFVFLLLYHAFFWKYDVTRKICTRRVICSMITVSFIGALQHLFEYATYGEKIGYATTTLYENAALAESHGGGIVGGLIGNFLVVNTSLVAAYFMVVFILLFMFLQLFNITPYTMVCAIAQKKDGTESKKKQKKQKPSKRKKVNIFEDDDDDEELLIERSKGNTPNYVDVDELLKNAKKPQEEPQENQDEEKPSEDIPVNEPEYKEPVANEEPKEERPVEKEPDYEIPAQEDTPQQDDPEFEIKVSKVEPEQIPFKPEEPYEEEEKRYINIDKAPELQVNKEPVVEEEPVSHFDDEEPANEPVVQEEPEYEDEEYEDDYEEAYEDELDDEDEELDDEELDDEEEEDYEEEYEDEEDEEAPIYQPEKNTDPDYEPLPIAPTPQERKTDITPVERPQEQKQPEKVFVPKPKKHYTFPTLNYLQSPENAGLTDAAQAELQENARIIVETLNNFNVRTTVSNVTRGPTVTRYELTPDAGVRVRSIANLADDIAMYLAAEGIRIECPIPGKSAVGIEVPNKVTSMVYLRELLEDEKFRKASSPMYCAVGKSISGENIFVDVEKTPHLLIAGATGMGKSVCINSLLVSLLYKATPDDVRMILIDPKRVELSNYNGIPHLLVPVVCEPKKSLGALQWAVTEMESRFETIEQAGVRNLHEFNEKVDNGYPADKMSRVLIVIDELADLKMAVPDIEGHITRLTQKARAAGIHIIIGTQRPSVDVITGLIKSNIPSRIAFRVPSQVDSRTILDEVGAEKLVSRGDMLVKIVGALRPARVQGSFVKASEIQQVIDYWKETSPAEYDEEVMHQIDNNAAKLAKNDREEDEANGEGGADDGTLDPEFYNALELACEMGKISSSFLQRKLRLGFQRAARLIDQMEECGYIGEANGSKPREVLISKDEFREIMMRRKDED
ncbi:MAG: hypothetical protein IJ004_05575 [Clostridia bacterium]|nr:hypothetical protein [Clostridia bacterium]